MFMTDFIIRKIKIKNKHRLIQGILILLEDKHLKNQYL